MGILENDHTCSGKGSEDLKYVFKDDFGKK